MRSFQYPDVVPLVPPGTHGKASPQTQREAARQSVGDAPPSLALHINNHRCGERPLLRTDLSTTGDAPQLHSGLTDELGIQRVLPSLCIQWVRRQLEKDALSTKF